MDEDVNWNCCRISMGDIESSPSSIWSTRWMMSSSSVISGRDRPRLMKRFCRISHLAATRSGRRSSSETARTRWALLPADAEVLSFWSTTDSDHPRANVGCLEVSCESSARAVGGLTPIPEPLPLLLLMSFLSFTFAPGPSMNTPAKTTSTPQMKPMRYATLMVWNSSKYIPPPMMAKNTQNTCSTGMMKRPLNRARARFMRYNQKTAVMIQNTRMM
mmetsp:Transcript_22954/g.33294  ORF Transcript_22954/g.33294 Transcript_22954/m.33294 type:complete len:217 (-) Transcript_22954:213-863(-)